MSGHPAWPGLHATTALDTITTPPSRPSAFFKALDHADTMAADAELLRQALAAAVGLHACECGESFDFPADASLNDYAALNRWLGYHSRCDQ